MAQKYSCMEVLLSSYAECKVSSFYEKNLHVINIP